MRRSKVPTVVVIVGLLLLASLVPAPGSVVTAKRAKRLTRAELEALAKDVGFPDPVYAATIALRESGGDPHAVNHNPPVEISCGLWQVNTLAWPKWKCEELLDARRNAEAAFEISQRGTNWGPWSTHKRGETGPAGVHHSRGSHGGGGRPPTPEELDPEPAP